MMPTCFCFSNFERGIYSVKPIHVFFAVTDAGQANFQLFNTSILVFCAAFSLLFIYLYIYFKLFIHVLFFIVTFD